MAARQRMNPTRSQAAATVYEDFQPKSDWVEDATANVLTIHLPGFTKDQVRVTYDERPARMTIRGERPAGNNVMSRFSKDFPIPDNCKLNEMKAKFDQRQVLTITMPKKTVTPPNDQKPQPEVASKAVMDQTKPPSKPREEKTSSTPGSATRDPAGKEPEKKIDETVAAPTTIASAPRVPEPKPQKEAPSQPHFRPLEDATRPRPPKIREESSSKTPPIPEKLPRDRDQKKTEPGPEPVDKKAVEHQEKAPKGQSHGKESTSPSSGQQVLDRIGKEAADLAAAARRAVVGMEEERKLLVNAGVAVLVIVAVGAYVGYKLGSSGGSNPRD